MQIKTILKISPWDGDEKFLLPQPTDTKCSETGTEETANRTPAAPGWREAVGWFCGERVCCLSVPPAQGRNPQSVLPHMASLSCKQLASKCVSQSWGCHVEFHKCCLHHTHPDWGARGKAVCSAPSQTFSLLILINLGEYLFSSLCGRRRDRLSDGSPSIHRADK